MDVAVVCVVDGIFERDDLLEEWFDGNRKNDNPRANRGESPET